MWEEIERFGALWERGGARSFLWVWERQVYRAKDLWHAGRFAPKAPSQAASSDRPVAGKLPPERQATD